VRVMSTGGVGVVGAMSGCRGVPIAVPVRARALDRFRVVVMAAANDLGVACAAGVSDRAGDFSSSPVSAARPRPACAAATPGRSGGRRAPAWICKGGY